MSTEPPLYRRHRFPGEIIVSAIFGAPDVECWRVERNAARRRAWIVRKRSIAGT